MLASAVLRLSDADEVGSFHSGDFFSFEDSATGSSVTSNNDTFVSASTADSASIDAALAAASRTMKATLSTYAMYFAPEFRKRLLKQIDVLLDPDEWEEGDPVPSMNSFRTLLRGLVFLKPVQRPALGMTASGNLLAMWSNDSSKVSLEFIPGDLIRWSGTKFVDGPPDQIASRTATIRLGDALAGFGLRDLIDGA